MELTAIYLLPLLTQVINLTFFIAELSGLKFTSALLSYRPEIKDLKLYQYAKPFTSVNYK